jgi:Bacterial inner membrane protein
VISSLEIQGIGVVAVVISLCIFQTNKRKNMLRLGTAASLIYAIHFYLLGAYAGSAMNVVNAACNGTFTKVNPCRENRHILYFFVALVTTATLVSWQGVRSLLPCMATIVMTFGFWTENTTTIRRAGMIASPLWMVYSIISGSYPGIFIEAVMITSNLIGPPLSPKDKEIGVY